ncbi:MAG: YiiX family permuted papain-like enzyme [Spirochaetota bacterium]
MQKNFLFVLLFCIGFLPVSSIFSVDFSSIREGDIIFQETRSRQAKALKLATKSKYTHAGMIIKRKGKFHVLEALQPVSITPLRSFIRRGVKRHFVVKRLLNSEKLLTPAVLKRIKASGKSFLGKNYDYYFGWSDKRIYCTELIWKAYHRGAGIKLGKLETLKDFDLSHPFVKKILRQRYGKKIPYNEKVISVSGMFAAKNLTTILRD